MATTSTLATARAAIVDALNTGALQNKVRYAWPGPEGDGENELCWVDSVPEWTQAIPNIKAGRIQRQESYTFEVVIWVAAPELTSDGCQQAMERVLVLCAVAENALADDVQLGETAIQKLEITDREYSETPYEAGWTCQVVLTITGQARLT